MNVTINIDDEKIIRAANEAIDLITPEELKDVVLDAFKKYFEEHSKEFVEKIFIREEKSYYETNYYAKPILIDFLNNGFSSEEISEYRKKIINVIEHDTHKLILNALIGVFAKNIVTSEFSSSITSAITEALTNADKANTRLDALNV